ncbi:TetR/AcrR family transcriptional regulator [Streptomyces zaomyceticus]|uniref:TetR/AcrR family transcriptional regulator n=1 Tax=Streptomyces zaomyceticus TaxID=68286 RepID=UPI0036CAC926
MDGVMYGRSGSGRLGDRRLDDLCAGVIEVLCEVGYDRLTMDTVATRTRSSKATLYRRWGSKADMVVTSLRHTPGCRFNSVDTGDLAGDLHALFTSMDERCLSRETALLRALSTAELSSPSVAIVAKSRLTEPIVTVLAEVLQRAVDRGEVAAGKPALGLVPDLVVGALAMGVLADVEPVTPGALAELVDVVLLPALGIPG